MANKKLNLIFGIIMSVLSLALGLTFLIQILRIYYGAGEYSRAICSNYLLASLPIIILWFIGAACFGVYFTINSSKNKSSKHSNIQKYKILKEKIDFNNLDEEIKNQLNNQKKKRMIVQISALVIVVICSIFSLLYAFNTKHYDKTNLTGSVEDIALYLLPFAVISFGVLIGAILYVDFSFKATNELLKKIQKSNGNKIVKNNNLRINIIRGCILALAITFIVVGLINDGARDTLLKAINICTECIGLG